MVVELNKKEKELVDMNNNVVIAGWGKGVEVEEDLEGTNKWWWEKEKKINLAKRLSIEVSASWFLKSGSLKEHFY